MFTRDPASGALTPAGCLADRATGTAAACAEVGSLRAVRSLAASPDGGSLYAASPSSNAVVAFARDPGGGLAKVGCLSGDDGAGQDPACGASTSVAGPAPFDLSPGARTRVALKLRRKAIRRLHLGRRFVARAIAVSRDGIGATATAERTVRVRR